MDLSEQLQQRLARVLELAERLLKRWAADEPDQAIFDAYHAFRWDASIGRGSSNQT